MADMFVDSFLHETLVVNRDTGFVARLSGTITERIDAIRRLVASHGVTVEVTGLGLATSQCLEADGVEHRKFNAASLSS